jgi:hypothetical protein
MIRFFEESYADFFFFSNPVSEIPCKASFLMSWVKLELSPASVALKKLFAIKRVELIPYALLGTIYI